MLFFEKKIKSFGQRKGLCRQCLQIYTSPALFNVFITFTYVLLHNTKQLRNIYNTRDKQPVVKLIHRISITLIHHFHSLVSRM